MHTPRLSAACSLAVAFALSLPVSGCGWTARAAAGAAFDTRAPIALEARGAVGGGIAAGLDSAILAVAEGSAGVDVRGGDFVGSGAGGVEYLIGPNPWGGRIGLEAGYRADNEGGNPFVQVQGGVSRAIGDASTHDKRSRAAVGGGLFVGYSFASVRPDRGQAAIMGLHATIEYDVLNEFTIPIESP